MVLLLFMLLCCSSPLPADDAPTHAPDPGWPQWLGPRGDGISPERDIFRPGEKPKTVEMWRVPIGRGYSSVSVLGQRAYTMEFRDEREQVVAFSAPDGRELWRFKPAADLDPEPIAEYGPYATPTLDGERVYALGSNGLLTALDAADGTLLWSSDLRASFGSSPLSFGYSTSPLVDGDRLLVLVGGVKDHNLVAFDKVTGEVAWSTFAAELGSYSTPVIGTLGGRRQIVVPAGDRLYGLTPDEGELLWSHEGPRFPNLNPLLLPDGGIFLLMDEYGAFLKWQAGDDRPEITERWRTPHFARTYSPAVYHDGALYGIGALHMSCLDAGTGEVHWRVPLRFGSLILVDDHLLVFDTAAGQLRIFAATTEKSDEIATIPVFDPDEKNASFTPPSFSARRIFLRSQQEIVALWLM